MRFGWSSIWATLELVLGLVEELLVLRAVDRHDLQGVLLAVGAAADVQDGAVGAGAERAEDLKLPIRMGR